MSSQGTGQWTTLVPPAVAPATVIDVGGYASSPSGGRGRVPAARDANTGTSIGDHGLVDHGLGCFGEPPVDAAGLAVVPGVLCDLVVVRRSSSPGGSRIGCAPPRSRVPSGRPREIVRMSSAQWLFDPPPPLG
ncbi:hypothetical protein [Actinomadura sp. 7K534]|uniref:hypothetical protein n=1 Tax=Actinomadura sp. 7K534 TaxID=2530366 RepID=UPI001052BB8D|nr:hypothetical protein [Actinomadura sp. 7K534]TDB97046.1 hypothetical protein E1266_07745 [Actinomadura sp. 7K534]